MWPQLICKFSNTGLWRKTVSVNHSPRCKQAWISAAPPQTSHSSFTIKDHGHQKARVQIFQLKEAWQQTDTTTQLQLSPTMCSEVEKWPVASSFVLIKEAFDSTCSFFCLALTANISVYPQKAYPQKVYFFLIDLFSFSVYACLPACVYTTCMLGTHKARKQHWDP